MIIRKSLLALALAASCALAALPSTMLFQGNMVVDGKPISGSKEMEVSLYDALTGGTEVWTKTYTAMFNNGYYAVALDNLEDVDFSQPLFVGLKIGTEISASRIPLTTAPYAKRAAVADSAVKAAFATTASQTLALAPSVHTLDLHGSADGTAAISQDSTVGTSSYSADLVLDAKDQEAALAVSSVGANSSSEARLTLTTNRVKLNSSVGYMGVQLGSIVYPADLPTCNAEMRGTLYIVASPSSYHADVLTWCQSYGNPGGSGYRWVYLDYDNWEVR
jgi:hypothetical protein